VRSAERERERERRKGRGASILVWGKVPGKFLKYGVFKSLNIGAF